MPSSCILICMSVMQHFSTSTRLHTGSKTLDIKCGKLISKKIFTPAEFRVSAVPELQATNPSVVILHLTVGKRRLSHGGAGTGVHFIINQYLIDTFNLEQ